MIRPDHSIILDWIKNDSSVLDLGCHEGELLSLIVKKNNVRAQGIEIDEQAIYKCVELGLSVSHQDIDNGLSEYGDESFDYVILNQSIQQVKKTGCCPEGSFKGTPNLHFLSISDFRDYCQRQGIRIKKSAFFNVRITGMTKLFPNLLAQNSLFLISK